MITASGVHSDYRLQVGLINSSPTKNTWLMPFSLQYLLLVVYSNNAIFMIGDVGRLSAHIPNHKNGPWFYFPSVLIIDFV